MLYDATSADLNFYTMHKGKLLTFFNMSQYVGSETLLYWTDSSKWNLSVKYYHNVANRLKSSKKCLPLIWHGCRARQSTFPKHFTTTTKQRNHKTFPGPSKSHPRVKPENTPTLLTELRWFCIQLLDYQTASL